MAATTLLYETYGGKYDERPDIRERLAASGTPSVADFELVAAILGTGSRGKDVRALAEELLATVDCSAGVPSVRELSAIPGVGSAQACRIAAALELGKRFFGVRERRVGGPEDAWQLVRHFDDRKQERFLCCTLNGAHDLIAVRVVTVGLVNRTIVHPREVFCEAVSDRACAVLVAHNHPSGRLEPSPEDKDITERLKSAGDILGIPLLDHIVFSRDGYISLMERGSGGSP
ncbi:MAG: DNA repair protein RadC [Spirochaetes bacterium]|nr:DNA repair protein RadC [Spirochaetota bacterium]MBU1080381.1 DNA repair protein RadC [Spirochaetota bacterium]